MQRVKHKEIKFISNISNPQQNYLYTYNNIIPNGNNNRIRERKSLINQNIMSKRSNKFLSIPERQKIIQEINKSKNQLNLYHPPEQKDIIGIKKNEENNNLIYIKKTKSNIDLNENKNRNSNKNVKYLNNKTENNHIKFTKNKNLINKTIKEYYTNKKFGNPIKTYFKSLDNNYNNRIKSRNIPQDSENREKNINLFSNEIYKKPISYKIYNKQNVNNIYEKDEIYKMKNSIPKDMNLKKLYITNGIRNEKMNCTKMINNNRIKKSIFNILNNYNTKTIKINSNLKTNSIKKNDNIKKINNQNNTKEFLNKNHYQNNYTIKYNYSNSNSKNLNTVYNKDYLINKRDYLQNNTTSGFNQKNKSCKINKHLNSLKSSYLKQEIKDLVLANNDYYILNKNENKNKKMFYSNSNNNLNLNLKSTNPNQHRVSLPKKKIFMSNFMSSDLPRILVEKNLISIANQNNGNQNFNDVYFKADGKDFGAINNNYFSERKYLFNKENDNYIDNNIENAYISTEIKNSRNKSYSLSFEPSPKKGNKRSRSFSYISNKEDETLDNYIYQNGSNKCQNGKSKSPSYRGIDNIYIPNNPLITKEVYFPFNINKNNSYYYNSDDDIMNSNNNSNICSNNYSSSDNNIITGINYNNSFDNSKNYIYSTNNKNYKSYRKSNNNIFNFYQIPSPSKDYYFNYLSNKINNDFLNEKKFKQFERKIYDKEIMKKKIFCEKCKRNYCPYCYRISPDFDIHNNSLLNKKRVDLNNNYYPSSIHSKSISMNIDNNILRNNLIKNKIERYDIREESIKKKIITRNVDLKLDVSNGKHSSENINLNFNLNGNALDSKSVNSSKLDANEKETNINLNSKNIETDKNSKKIFINEDKKDNNLKDDKNINDIKDKEINIENVVINKKGNEMDGTEQIKSLSEITSSERFIIKGEATNLSNSDFILNENNNNDKMIKRNVKDNDLSKDNEEKQNKSYKINLDIQNIQVTPTTKRNSFIKDISINNNDNNFTKTDIDTNINNTNNTNSIIKNLSVKDEFKNNLINNRNKVNLFDTPLSKDIMEYLNIITPKNYFIIKDKIVNLIINNDYDNSSLLFANILYPIAINQKKFQPIYSKLCKDVDKHHKKDKTKSVLRAQLMKLCKTNFKKIKNYLENIIYIENDINFIGELINAQMVSKKVGQQCLTHLINKFNQYNTNNLLKNRKNEKYLYLNCIINLVNQFGTCINCFKKDKIRKDELLHFQNDISNNILILKEILENKMNDDMPNQTKIQLLQLIKKSENNWEFTLLEKAKNEILKMIYEEELNSDINNNNSNNIINNNNLNKNNKQFKSLSPINIKNNKEDKINKNNSGLYLNNKTNDKNNLKIKEYTKIFRDNLNLFKNHLDENKPSDNFNNWEEIDTLFLNKKISKDDLFKSIIEATKYFLENKEDLYYIDIYIKIILEYYYNYFNKNDINKIINIILEELSQLSYEEIKKEENKYIIEIWIVMIYYLLENKIIIMNIFDHFCKGYNKEVKINIWNILNGVCCYNVDNKNIYLKELNNTKFAHINK